MSERFGFWWIVSIVVIIPTCFCWAMYMQPDDTFPFERLYENLLKQLETSEKPADIHAQIARTCSLAFAYDQGNFSVSKNYQAGEGNYRLYGSGDISYGNTNIAPGAEERIGLLLTSIEHYEKAAELDPENAYSHLGLAFTRRTATHYAKVILESREEEVSEASITQLKQEYEKKALAEYRVAFELSTQNSHWGRDAIISESAHAIVEILESRPEPSEDEKREIKYVRRTAIDNSLQIQAITPIILSLEDRQPLEQLLNKEKTVLFDLDGLGARQWPWVKPETAFLVWDGNGDQQVRSGRQLIGSVTWWLFWENGYQVLQALDDDADGWLSGIELKGLAVWQDRNSNGVSDAGEVRNLGVVGIKKLETRITGKTSGMPFNAQGVQFNDGRYLPTYDWITHAAE